jgi:hypothetical protein
MTAASRSLATALWKARFASGLLLKCYTTCRDTIEITLSRLNGWRICSPTDASPAPSRTPAHGSGPMWLAAPTS